MIITVRGVPAPQGSKRIVKAKNGEARMIEMSKAVGPWREAVRAETQRACHGRTLLASGPVMVEITFGLPRPKGHYGTGRNADKVRDSAPWYPAGRPDVDKLARAVLDGLTEGGAWADDGQVVCLTVRKVYDTPGCIIRVEPVGEGL
jgi:crossover junction endodeoxyribonuclease RusA